MSSSGRNKLLLAVIFVVTIIGIKSDDRGFLLTAPNTLYVDTNETMCISFHYINANGTLAVKLVNMENIIIESTSISIIQGKSTCFELPIPPTSSSSAILKVEGNFNSLSYTFVKEAKVTISKNSLMTFIETDKKIYKHGQKVRFRIFRLTNKLLPVFKAVPEVWIENPSDVRVAQWRRPHIKRGLTDLSFELSDEPPLGEWKIYLKSTFGNKEKQTFLVQEYVLPKFEITLITPDVLFEDFESFPLKVCSHYTYGRPVHGKLKLVAVITVANDNTPNNNYSSNEPFNLIEGCHEMTIFSNNFTLETVRGQSFSQKKEYDTSITYFAEVIEHGTGVKINKSKSQEILRHRLQFEYKSKSYFKPNMPYFGKIAVQHRNGIPAVNEKLVLKVESREETHLETHYVSDHLGEVNFVFEPKGGQTYTISLKETTGLWKSNIVKSLMSWYSPTNSFLQMGPIKEKVGCADNSIDLLVNFTMAETITTEEIIFFYQIVSRGRLLIQQNKTYIYNNLQPSKMNGDGLNIGNVILQITLSPQMSPVAHFLVYYIRKDNEIVSDSQEFAIENCFENNVTMSFDDDEIPPSTTSNIVIMAQPQSICALSVVDKSAHLLSSDNFLGIDKVFKAVSKTYPKKVTPSNIRRDCHHRYWPFHPRTENTYVDIDKAFNDAGLVTISNLDFKVPPCKMSQQRFDYVDYDYTDSTSDDYDYTLPQRMVNSPVPNPRARYPMPRITTSQKLSAELPRLFNEPIQTVKKPTVEIRDYFPETWLWELHHIGKNGSRKLKREIPHSITTWIGTTFCLSEHKGLGVSQQHTVRGFQAFFISFTMPYSIKNEEVAPIIVTVFSYLSKCIPVRIFIEDSDKYVLVSNASSVQVCLCSLPHTHTFWIRPSFIGSINITVYAHSATNNVSKMCTAETGVADVTASDAATNQILVKAQGFPREFSNTSWICQRAHSENTFRQEFDLLLPRDVIQGSEKASVSIIGDLMGPTVQGLESLVKLPVGCGEQNMVLFAPNVHVLHYLTNSGQLTEDIKGKAKNHLRTGYQRQLNYKHPDGSYSAFGKMDRSGSIWLTAFVLKSFSQAKPFVYIDLQELKNCKAFIYKNQLSDGSFKATGRVLSKSMQGGIGSDSSDQSLAAYILIALLEAGSAPNSTHVNLTFDYLISHDSKQENTYLLAMKAYAATLAKRNELVNVYMKRLNQRATRQGNMLYWSKGNRHDSHAMDIEITSYVLLTLVSQNLSDTKGDALSIVRWLTKQRNAYGGFVSTQDTILALQALAKYAGTVHFDNVSLEIVLDAVDMENVTLQVNDENKLVQQIKKIPVLPTHLDIEVTGKGCVMVQLTLKYNVRNNGPTDAFNLDVRVIPVQKTCSMKQLEICTSYKLDDGHSNMAVIEVQMISGFEADTNSLDVLQNSVDVQLKRWEISPEGFINLYFDEITQAKKCFSFHVIEKFKVQENKPAIIRAFDYYEPELTVSATYSFPVDPNCDKVLAANGTIY